jgi:hypothetical protein
MEQTRLDGFESGRPRLSVRQAQGGDEQVVAGPDCPEPIPTRLLPALAPAPEVEHGAESHGHDGDGGLCLANARLQRRAGTPVLENGI